MSWLSQRDTVVNIVKNRLVCPEMSSLQVKTVGIIKSDFRHTCSALLCMCLHCVPLVKNADDVARSSDMLGSMLDALIGPGGGKNENIAACRVLELSFHSRGQSSLSLA